MPKCECWYYTTSSGNSPVKEFIQSLDDHAKAKFYFKKGLLDEFGWRLPAPHAKHIGNDIEEVRFLGVVGHLRILYFFFTGYKIIFTNGFVKKKDKTPKNEIALALDRKRDFLIRMKVR
jgi:phage-related protein